jgi:hypothetical protein
MGSVPMNLAAVRTAAGQRCLGVAIDRTGTCASAERPEAATTMRPRRAGATCWPLDLTRARRD